MSGLTAVKIRVYGIVQGVGFRPFTARLARDCGVTGTVCNKGPFVELTAEGSAASVDAFVRRLRTDAPERSAILKLERQEISPAGETFFRILKSEKLRGDIFISPDIATCRQCERELFDPANRRYLHPFINCTACGPRVTILDAMPYDRKRTSMKVFPMCVVCEAEYTSPASRRYHAQPVCCSSCGPELYLAEPEGTRRITGSDALLRTREVIRAGGIAAVKGIGGFHLCADASNAEAVSRLRRLKARPFKPFAVMMRDIDAVRRCCVVTKEQEEILEGPNKPILLLRKRSESVETMGKAAGRTLIAEAVAPDNPYLGVMLPYAPVQMLLFAWPDGEVMPDALIMTSGNAKDTPICMNDDEAIRFLSPLCDVILSNDRAIRLRADDSVMQWFDGAPYMIRRSRGYAPLPVMTSAHSQSPDEREVPRQILAIGGELKNTFCLAKGTLYYPSPYIGNLTDTRGTDALQSAVCRMEELLELRPERIVCDLHPHYLSAVCAAELAEERGIPLVKVQHHHAHILSCMAEHDYNDPVIGIAFDGTGYGPDGTVWGGEFLIASRDGFRRAGSLAPFAQAGGDLAPREGWRIAAALLDADYTRPAPEGRMSSAVLPDTGYALPEPEGRMGSAALPDADYTRPEPENLAEQCGVCTPGEYAFIRSMIRNRINTVTSTSAGRVFDAASAVLGFRRCSTSEGEASMVLQFAAEAYVERCGGITAVPEDALVRSARECLVSCGEADAAEPFRLPVSWLIRALAERRVCGADTNRLAYAFHAAMAELMLRGALHCRELTGLTTVALSGGVLQNTLLLSLAVGRLEREGFRVLRHHMIPPNDGGIALGQAYYTGDGEKEEAYGKIV